jgi:hypothetical protein
VFVHACINMLHALLTLPPLTHPVGWAGLG